MPILRAKLIQWIKCKVWILTNFAKLWLLVRFCAHFERPNHFLSLLKAAKIWVNRNSRRGRLIQFFPWNIPISLNRLTQQKLTSTSYNCGRLLNILDGVWDAFGARKRNLLKGNLGNYFFLCAHFKMTDHWENMKSRHPLRLRIVNGYSYKTYSAINLNIHFTCMFCKWVFKRNRESW